MFCAEAIDQRIDRVVAAIFSNLAQAGIGCLQKISDCACALIADFLPRRFAVAFSKCFLQALLSDAHGLGNIGRLYPMIEIVFDPMQSIGN